MSDKYHSSQHTKNADYGGRYGGMPNQRFDRNPGLPAEGHTSQYGSSFEYPAHQRGNQDYYPKDPVYPPPPASSYQHRRDFEPYGRRGKQEHTYDSDYPRRKPRTFNEEAPSPEPYYRSRYPESENPRNEYHQREYYRPSNDAPQEYRRSYRNREEPDYRRREEMSPPRQSRYNGSSRGSNSVDRNRDILLPENNIIQDSIYISNLPLDTTLEELAKLFGSIGPIKRDEKTGALRIKIYKTQDGQAKGEATISFEDDKFTKWAIDWFNQTEFKGKVMKVQMAERSYSTRYNSNRGGRMGFQGSSRGRDDRGPRSVEARVDPGRGRPKPSFVQPGDWLCALCKNNNFAWRTACNRCQAPKPESRSEDYQRSPHRANVPPGQGQEYRYH